MATRKVIITTDFPTPEQVAAFYRIPPTRVAELKQMISEIRAADARKKVRKATRKPAAAKTVKKK